MRKCKAVIYNRMKTVDGVCVADKETVYGLFHEWGLDYDEFDNGAAGFTVAIIELADGEVVIATPQNVKFLPEGEPMPGWEGRE